MSMVAGEPAAVPIAGLAADSADLDGYVALVRRLRAGSEVSAMAPHSVGVTSCARGTGVSTVASKLAAVAAQTGKRPVLLLDLSGLTQIPVVEPYRVDDLNQRDATEALIAFRERVVPSPRIANLFTARIHSTRDLALDGESGGVAELLRFLEQDYGFVVVDLPTTDSSLCFATAGMLNGVLLVLEAERTSYEAAFRGKQTLDQSRANILGVILNKHSLHLPRWLETRI